MTNQSHIQTVSQLGGLKWKKMFVSHVNTRTMGVMDDCKVQWGSIALRDCSARRMRLLPKAMSFAYQKDFWRPIYRRFFTVYRPGDGVDPWTFSGNFQEPPMIKTERGLGTGRETMVHLHRSSVAYRRAVP